MQLQLGSLQGSHCCRGLRCPELNADFFHQTNSLFSFQAHLPNSGIWQKSDVDKKRGIILTLNPKIRLLPLGPAPRGPRRVLP